MKSSKNKPKVVLPASFGSMNIPAAFESSISLLDTPTARNSPEFSQVIGYLSEANKAMYEMFGKIIAEHFKQLEKQSDKQMKVLEKQSQQFLTSLEGIVNYEKAKEEKEAFKPVPLNSEKVENTIEEKDTEEVDLSDSNRVPIVDGVKIKFEDEEDIYQPNITPMN